jgi:hypothetical protein
MMKKERCAIDGLLLEGNKEKPSNLLQRLGFDRYEKKIILNNYLNTSIFMFQDPFLIFGHSLKTSQGHFEKKENQTMRFLTCN